MGPSEASSTAGAAVRGVGPWRARLCRAVAAGLLVAFAGCSPEYDWREVRAPGGEYLVQLPAKPASMTRRIHLEDQEVDMTMQGARVGENAFTVAVAPLPEGMAADRMLAAMREQMLRNIGAPAGAPPAETTVVITDAGGARIGTQPAQGVQAQGTGPHAAMRMRARFLQWRGLGLQIVAIGPDLDPAQADHFLASLRLVAP